MWGHGAAPAEGDFAPGAGDFYPQGVRRIRKAVELLTAAQAHGPLRA